MLKRYATLMFGVALLGLGALFFALPERTYVLQILVRFWPLFLILAGVVRVAGHLIDRHPRSPVGGLMLTSLGGILLAANLRGDRTFIHIFGRYWFWLLLALIAGRVIRQYTHRPQDGPRPRTFGFGTILLIVLITGGGLAANFISNNIQLLSRWNLRLGTLTEVRDYVFGDKLAVDDEPAQSFALQPNARLVIGDVFGDIEIKSGSQPLASAKLVKSIRAVNEEEAREAAKNIRLQIVPDGDLYRLSVNAQAGGPLRAADFSTALVIELPALVPASIEVQNPIGLVKLSNLRGDHTISNGDRIEVFNNAGRVLVSNPRGAVQLRQIQGEVIVTNARRDATLREIVGNVSLEALDGAARIEQVTGQIKAKVNNTRLEIREVQSAWATDAVIVNLAESSNSQISVRDINGSVNLAATNSRFDANTINGDLTVSTSNERVRVGRIAGQVRLSTEGGSVEAEELHGSAVIEAARDVTVRNFRGPLNVTTRLGHVRLSTDTQLGGDVSAISHHGQIRVALPLESSFRLDASTTFGKLRLRGFENLDLSRNQKAVLVTSQTGNASAPLLHLRSVKGDIRLEPFGLAAAAHER
jgi:DUF4097 and DUF4098 domain-containing protein YvlB